MNSLGFTPKVQQLMILCRRKGFLTQKEQDIYDSQRYYDAIRFLRNNNLIKPICYVCHVNLDDGENAVCSKKNIEHAKSYHCYKKYILTLKGEIVARFLAGLK
ncbi:hypothetical protein KKC87_04415 [Patescibacteria group bacterium]|nr:hypothetical protein [Patescibacteria group bacterium]